MSEVDFKDPSSWDYGNIFKGLFGTGATYAAVDDILNRLTSAGQGLSEEFPKIGIEAANRAAFKPFTVTTGTGGVGTTPEGGINLQLGGQGAGQTQAIQNILGGMLGGFQSDPTAGAANLLGDTAFSGAQNFLGSAMTDPSEGMIGRSGQAALTGAGNLLQNIGVDPTGGMAGGIRDTSLGNVSNLIGSALGDRSARESDIYNRIRAIQSPEEQRQREALNDQLLSQGRLDLMTSAYGGSPEQFAMDNARAEAMNQAALSAMNQAGTERDRDLGMASSLYGLGAGAAGLPTQLQSADAGLASNLFGMGTQAQFIPQQLAQGNLGLSTGMFGLGSQARQLPTQLQGMQGQNIAQMMGLQYLPEQQMLDALGAGTNVASIADLGRRQGAGLFDESAGSGLEALMNTELAKADILKSIYSGALGGGGDEGGSWFGDIISGIFGD